MTLFTLEDHVANDGAPGLLFLNIYDMTETCQRLCLCALRALGSFRREQGRSLAGTVRVKPGSPGFSLPMGGCEAKHVMCMLVKPGSLGFPLADGKPPVL